MTKKYGWHKITNLRKKPEVRKKDETDGGRDLRILQALSVYAKNKPQSNLTEVKIENVTRKTKIAFFILPEWSINFPPYNVARLAAVSKHAGYETYAYDLNARSYQRSKKWNLDYDPWSGTRDWKWTSPHYMNELHPHLESYLQEHIELVVEKNIDVVGFSLYYCNAEATKWFVKELKSRKPDIKVIVGGPECQNGYWVPEPEYDYIVTGEGEQMLLEVLDNIENGSTLPTPMHLKQQEGERLDLDKLPPPDYSYFPPEHYNIPNGINFELSRGCTAKCVFCSETHFWKYRGRMASRVVSEIEELYYNRGVDVVWFLDSLVNGNLKELRGFAKGIIASGIKISWTGYARCDERMDLEYYKDLAESGCIGLSYGIESGSDKVLADMDKGVTVKDIEQNLRDGATVGIDGFSTWITGFPTEEPQDHYETMTMIWRNRNTSLNAIPSGAGFNITPETIVAQNMSRFNVANMEFEGNWICNDLTNTKYHRLIRLKTFAIFLNNLVNDKDTLFGDRPNIVNHYDLDLKDNVINEIEFEKFDFNICKPNVSPFADSLMNEVWPLLRLFYRTRGAYSMKLVFNPELDVSEYGGVYAGDFNATIDFDIDSDGNYKADLDFNFKQKDDAWKFFDQTGSTSIAADRARKLSGKEESSMTFDELYRSSIDKYTNLNLSFSKRHSVSGRWE
jgi:hypothetical protein